MEQTLRFLRMPRLRRRRQCISRMEEKDMKRDSWVQVDLDGLREKLKRRGIRFAVYEPIQNALDEDVTRVDVTLRRPERK